MNLRLAFIIVIVVLVILYIFRPVNLHMIKSTIDGEFYGVLDKLDKKRAANTLAIVNAQMLAFLEHLKEKYAINSVDREIVHQYHPKAQEVVDLALRNYNFESINENRPTGRAGTSYTLDKGRKLMICLRNKRGQIHDKHTIMFVMLHELAHMGNKKWGHGRDFWRIFKFLLIEAAKSGFHIPRDYQNYPVTYCGLDIDYNPYYDDTLPSIAEEESN